MSERFEDGQALWLRLRAAEDPDPLLLAAYAEGRLEDRLAREMVERWLATDPEAAADVAAIRAGETDAPEIPAAVLERVTARAEALVAAPGGRVVAFRQASRGPLRGFAQWGALAASLVMVSYLGFALGSDTFTSLMAPDRDGGPALNDMIDPPSSFFGSFVELES